MGTRDIKMGRRGVHPPTNCGSNRGKRQLVGGQIAISFLAMMVFVLMLVKMTINLGQMSQVRVETSNAADAGALAAASWVASGQNEAAAVAQKMWDSIAMVQALYLVPYCPDAPPPFPGAPAENHSGFARALWRSLVRHPGTGRDGPIRYFRDVGDVAMASGWVLGGREFLTASLNNMMMRYNTGPAGLDLDNPEYNFQSLPNDIRQHQEDASMGLNQNIKYGSLVWNNSKPLDDPKHLTHQPYYEIERTRDVPAFEMREMAMRYWQYAEEEPQTIVEDPGDRFIKSFAGVGVNDVWPNATDGPVVELPSDSDLPPNPLAVVDTTGRKAWDMDLRPMIPNATHLDISACRDPVSGEPLRGTLILEQRQTAQVKDIRPVSIVNGEGSVRVLVSHEVVTADGTDTVPNPDKSGTVEIPIWQSRFPGVASEARARYTAATVTNPPVLNADAQLTSAR